MIVTHTLTVVRRCPRDDTLDRYAVTVTVRRLLAVEDILGAVVDLPERAYQEEITQQLASALGAEVVTVGTHSGVVTRCSC